jgi:hypothetical protein
MKTSLLDTLVNRNLVTENTVIYAKVRTTGLGGTPTVVKKDIYWTDQVPAGSILDIEGMAPERFAQAYNIKSDGTTKQYKKRGRKPKAEMA